MKFQKEGYINPQKDTFQTTLHSNLKKSKMEPDLKIKVSHV